MERTSSLMELRKDPQYHGIRYPKPPRVIGKGGDRNIGITNIPNKMLHAWKDIVTTLVSKYVGLQFRKTYNYFQ